MSKKYRPSNGTEGDFFINEFCMACKHERYQHTYDDNDLKCDIFSRSLIYDLNDPEYPEEWVYDKDNKPTCTAHKFWDWDKDGEPEIEIKDPNQLNLF